MTRLIEFFLDNRVAANLLAGLLVLVGVLASGTLIIRIFPQIDPFAVDITVPYPGASPEEVEEGIVEPIEEQLEGLEGVKKITAVAGENVANIVIELRDGEDTAEFVNEVRTQVGQITVFPEDAEEPQIGQVEPDELIAQVILSGDVDALTLKRIAQDSQRRLTSTKAVSRARVSGVPDYLIDIAVPSSQLEALGTSLPQLASVIGAQSLELSGGEIEGPDRRTLVRTLGENETGEEFEDVIVSSSGAGAPIRLSDIAVVTDGLADTPIDANLNGEQAVALLVFRVGDERVFDIIEAVNEEIAFLEKTAPAGVAVTLWNDQSVNLQSRIDLLVRNAILGLILVTGILLLFLDVRVAFWVAVGVGVSFVAAFVPMALFGVAISQLSLFGFILAIGIVVDDAIVVGENIYSEVERGQRKLEAARKGVLRVTGPVLFSVSTTIVAFLALIFIPGTFGQFLGAIASVVIFVLFMSLVESFFILPKHLSHLTNAEPGRFTLRRFAEPASRWTARRLDEFSEQRLRPAVSMSVAHPVVTIAGAVGVLVASFGVLASGLVKFDFFPPIEGNFLIAEIELAEAASETQTRAALQQIVDGAYVAAEEVAREVNANPDDVLTGVFWTLGEALAGGGPPSAGASGGAAPNRGFVSLRMQDAAEREFTSEDLENAWRAATGPIAGAQTLSFSADLISDDADVTLNVTGEDDATTRSAMAALRSEVEQMPGARSVRDDRFRTTEEVQIELSPAARALGVPLEDVARQVRAAFFGAEAVRIQRDQEEIEVRLRLPEAERADIGALLNKRIFFNGAFIPISQLADVSVGDAPSIINRQDGRRIYTLEADADLRVTTGDILNRRIFQDIWPKLQDDFPGVQIGVGGEQQEQSDAQGALQRNFLIAIFVIYALLALAFSSYTQPLVILMIVPFGLVGALIGHALLGLNLSLLSMFGVIGLSGVIINDALLMVDFINNALARGVADAEAIVEGAVSRFRPILLTSLTTCLGVTPIILERSVQAAFLVPTAVSLGFGIVFGTLILMFVVPAAASLHLRLRGAASRVGSAFNRKAEEATSS